MECLEIDKEPLSLHVKVSLQELTSVFSRAFLLTPVPSEFALVNRVTKEVWEFLGEW